MSEEKGLRRDVHEMKTTIEAIQRQIRELDDAYVYLEELIFEGREGMAYGIPLRHMPLNEIKAMRERDHIPLDDLKILPDTYSDSDASDDDHGHECH